MMTNQRLTENHRFFHEVKYRLKSTLLSGVRFIHNVRSPPKLFIDEGKLIGQPTISFSESDLWNPSDNKDNWILTAGKIENLRIAARQLNGLEVKANEVFSFWKHIGNPNFGKGYVTGREIREGCIVPTIAGGLCQLSNALYDAALKANFEIIERHKHTKVIKGSLAEQDRDATVKWNYIDLRFKSAFDFRMEIELTGDRLLVVFKSEKKLKSAEDHLKTSFKPSNKLNDCYSCGNAACFKSPGKTGKRQEDAVTTFILDEKWPEYEEYIKSLSKHEDHYIIPLKKNSLFRSWRYGWTVRNAKNLKATTKEGIWRALKLRFFLKAKINVFELTLGLDKKIAQRASGLIPVQSTHLVVAQNFLPFLFEAGALGGRTFDVLMNRLPVEKLQERLDYAHQLHPESETLRDFRAPKQFIELENQALTKARKIITPHAEIAEIFQHKSVKLNWILPEEEQGTKVGNKVLFPASALGRKGAYEMKALLKQLKIPLVVSGPAMEKKNFWEALPVEKFSGNFDEVGLILFPTFIEHQPRRLLKAISKGIPIITTTASGLEEAGKVKILPIGDYNRFIEEVKKHREKETVQ